MLPTRKPEEPLIILDVVQFRTTYHHYLPFKEVLMKVRVGKWDAIGYYKEVCVLKIGGIDWYQLQLDRPLRKHRNGWDCRTPFHPGLRDFKMHGP
jgi:hypothetical protein